MSVEKLRGIIAEVFEDQSFVLKPEMNLKEIKNWDSFNLIGLVMAIEKAFKIKFSAGEVNSLQKVSDILSIIEAKGVNIATPA